MYSINMQGMSQEFFECCKSAGMHLDKQVQGGIQSWLRVEPKPPFLEHLSFRLGNQLFFVRIEDVDGLIEGPGTLQGLLSVADGNKGHACLLPMKKSLGGSWTPVHGGWGLVDAQSGKVIDPVLLVSNENIEMTAWECQDLGVQIVREHLENEGYEIMSWQGNPGVDPAIWFIGESKGPEWIVVRVTTFPENHATRPNKWSEIVSQCAHMSDVGHFASVALVSEAQPFESENEQPVPLWRGHGINARFVGLE